MVREWLNLAVTAMGACTIAAVLVVIRLHSRAYRMMRQSGRPISGLLPWHVVAISTSHVILIGSISYSILTGVKPPMFRLGLYAFAFTLTLAALWIMGGYQLKKVAQTKETVVTEQQVTTVQAKEGIK